MIVAEIEKRSRSEIGVRFPALITAGEQVCDMKGVPIGVVRSVDGDLVKIAITDPLAGKLVEEGALNAIALLDGRLTVIDNPMLVKSGGAIWKVAEKMSNQSISDQLKSIVKTLERLAERTGGPQVPARSQGGGGALRQTAHGMSPAQVSEMLGTADKPELQDRLAYEMIRMSGAARPINARPVGYSQQALAKFAGVADGVAQEDQTALAAELVRDVCWRNGLRRA